MKCDCGYSIYITSQTISDRPDIFCVTLVEFFQPHRVFQKKTSIDKLSLAKGWILINILRQCLSLMLKLVKMLL